MFDARSMSEGCQNLIEEVAPHLSPPVKRVAGGVAPAANGGAELCDLMVIVIAVLQTVST